MELEQQKMEKVNEILQLCFKINDLEQRERELTGNEPTVFFEFFGHTADLKIMVYELGWYSYDELKETFDEYSKSYIKMEIHLYEPFEEIKDYMDECIQYLKALEMRCQNEYLQQAV